jgi:predicted transcriptional regulator of viral defense system
VTRSGALTRTAIVDALAAVVARGAIERLQYGEYGVWPLEGEEREALRYAVEDALRSVLGEGRKRKVTK